MNLPLQLPLLLTWSRISMITKSIDLNPLPIPPKRCEYGGSPNIYPLRLPPLNALHASI